MAGEVGAAFDQMVLTEHPSMAREGEGQSVSMTGQRARVGVTPLAEMRPTMKVSIRRPCSLILGGQERRALVAD
jgi:hypothetical protein